MALIYNQSSSLLKSFSNLNTLDKNHLNEHNGNMFFYSQLTTLFSQVALLAKCVSCVGFILSLCFLLFTCLSYSFGGLCLTFVNDIFMTVISFLISRYLYIFSSSVSSAVSSGNPVWFEDAISAFKIFLISLIVLLGDIIIVIGFCDVQLA